MPNWGYELTRDMNVYSHQQLLEMNLDAAERARERLGLDDAGPRGGRGTMSWVIRVMICAVLILAAALTAVTLILAVEVRSRFLSGMDGAVEANCTFAYSALEDLCGGAPDDALRENSYYCRLFNAAATFPISSASTSYIPESEQTFTRPEWIDYDYYLAAARDGKILFGSSSYIDFVYAADDGTQRSAVCPLPEDFPVGRFGFSSFDGRKGVSGTASWNSMKCDLKGWLENGWLFHLVSMYDASDAVYQSGAAVPDGAALITQHFDGRRLVRLYGGSSPFRLRGVKYPGLDALAAEFAPLVSKTDDSRLIAHYGLWNTVYLNARFLPSPDGEGAVTMIYAARCSPVSTAMKSLTKVYVITMSGMALLAVIFIFSIRGGLVRPMKAVELGAAENVFVPYGKNKMWREAQELYAYERAQTNYIRGQKNEITRLSTALDYARKAEENRREMVSAIAHELKTPLAVIHAYAEGLQERIAEDRRDEYLSTILSEAEKMDGMVLEMLDLSRLEAGRVKLSRDEFSLTALAERAAEKFAPIAAERGLTVTVHSGGDCRITADEARISQVTDNLFSNAVRYTPEGGNIDVYTYEGTADVSLTVENTGAHFTDEELSKLWDVFYMTDSARGGSGSGLGLAIVKNIVRLHGGSAEAGNTDGGVRFSVTLPR